MTSRRFTETTFSRTKDGEYCCDECGEEFEYKLETDKEQPPTFCPCCGRKRFGA